MAITAVPDIKGRSGKPYLGTDTETTVQYIVYTETKTQGEAAIMASGCLPSRGDVFSENAYLAAFQISLKREDANALMWRATIQYKTDSLDQKEKDKILYPNPCNRPAEVEWDAIGYQVPAVTTVEDYTPPGEADAYPAGSPIVNAAWDKFDPPAEKTDYHWSCSVTKFVSAVPVWLLSIPGTVNNASFTVDSLSVDAGCARITGLRIGRRQRENGFNYREVKFTLEFRRKRDARTPAEAILGVPDPWILEVENMGYNKRPLANPAASAYQFCGDETAYERIVDANNKPVPVPVYLTASGDVATDPTPATTTKRHFKIYRTSDFSQLPLT